MMGALIEDDEVQMQPWIFFAALVPTFDVFHESSTRGHPRDTCRDSITFERKASLLKLIPVGKEF